MYTHSRRSRFAPLFTLFLLIATIFTSMVLCEGFLAADLFAAQKAPVPEVKAVRAVASGSEGVLVGMGTIRSSNHIDLGFEVTGVVSKLPVKEGDRVEKGQTLAELDSAVLKAETGVKEAEAEYASAEVDYYREEYLKHKDLHEKQAVSDKEMKKAAHDLRKAEASLKRTKAELAVLRERLRERVLRSPISGIVAKRYVEEGSVVTPGAHRVMRLIRIDEVVVDIDMGESLYLMVRPGQRIRLSVDALGGKEFWSKVERISPEIDRRLRTFTAHVRVDNPDLVLLPGMFVRAEIFPPKENAPVWVPKTAILKSARAGDEVFVVKDGVAVRSRVRIGEQSGDRVQIVAGVKEGDTVLVEGHENLPNLTEVSVSYLQGK